MVHTLDEKEDDIIAWETCFKIGNNSVERWLNEEKKLFVELSIKNPKDDNEDSGISDEK